MPSWRNARVFSPIFWVGKSAKQMEMSIAVMTSSTTFAKRSTSKDWWPLPSSFRNFIRFSEARLQDVLSRCMYSLQGFEPLIRPDSGQVCQWLMVSSYWMPGSAQAQAASAILRNRALASTSSMTSPVIRARRPNLPPCSTAFMNSSFTRTELLAFWYWTDAMSSPPRSMSKPASRRTRIFSSSLTLVSMKSSMSGWSTSRMTILAARRVAPPDLIVPAEASAPRMKETGPEALPPEESSSLEERMRERFRPAPEPPLKIMPSSLYQSRIDSMESSTDRMKQALTCCGWGVPTLNHTGLLKLKIWCRRAYASSCSKISASAGEAKYLLSSPAFRYVFTMRSISCLRLVSRCGVPTAPRKYLLVTMLTAFTDQKSGNSTPRCSKLTEPSRQLVMTTSRRSHDTSSYVW